jgi:RNA polymerase sigma-70 factor, ECF subfamily
MKTMARTRYWIESHPARQLGRNQLRSRVTKVFRSSGMIVVAEHAHAPTASATDWRQIVALYDGLFKINPTPVIELNRAVAVAMRDGPEAGLALLDDLLSLDGLAEYHLAYASKAELLRRTGRFAESITAYENALRLARQEPEIRYLRRRLEETQRQLG